MLTAANAFFVAAEFSLVTVDRSEIDQLADAGDKRARTVRRALRHLSFQLSGAQLGITISALLTGYIAQPAFDVILKPLGLPKGLNHAVALGIATLLSMLLGELVPKNAALASPMPLALRTAAPLRIFSRTFTWLIFALNGTANWLVRRLGIEPQEELASARSPEELGLLAAISAQAGALPTETALLLQRTVRFREKRAAEAMTPRVDVIGLTKEATIADLIAISRESGLSRFPIYEETLDQVNGVVSLIDALSVKPAMRATTSVATVAREPILVPETLDLDGVWAALRAGGSDLAIVVDEYGGTDGVVTIEDLVEELVGEIADEHDVEEFPEAVDLMVLSDAREHVVDGVLREDELREQTGFRLPDGPYETLAGFLMAQLGHIPHDGEAVTYKGWEFTVVEMDRHRVEQVRVVRPATDEDGDRS
ncbi:CBS domain containing-hemolysin-like protein [Allocatelliglobosispora scoriae]|uniref:CBS domain containing-hemolysin-like protein n=1 Tax=Allocatelliglobosispora scoriae TaxID=643052 RepID=A0A841BPS8_9ACTN|nr:CBS domain containing-hemolysin-like protein [Allocatelliglobosispora scoriae]